MFPSRGGVKGSKGVPVNLNVSPKNNFFLPSSIYKVALTSIWILSFFFAKKNTKITTFIQANRAWMLPEGYFSGQYANYVLTAASCKSPPELIFGFYL